MVLNTFLLNVYHPMRFLPRNNKIYLATDGVTEIEGPGYEDKRKWYVTVLDPFDMGGMLRGNKLEDRFWETHAEGRGETVKSDVGTDVEAGRARS